MWKVDGHALAAYRERAWMHQKDLAEESNVSRATINGIERGRIKSPRRETIMALAGALGVAPEELLESVPLVATRVPASATRDNTRCTTRLLGHEAKPRLMAS